MPTDSPDFPPNCVKQLLAERAYSNRKLARLTGLSESKISRIVNQKVDLAASELLVIAQALGVHPGELFVAEQRQIETAGKFLQPDTANTSNERYRYWLSAEDRESRVWLWRGLIDWEARRAEGDAEETPGSARIRLAAGRTLLGRAVEADGDFASVPAERRLVLARDTSKFPEDTKLSRLHCDFSVAPTHNHVLLCVHGRRGISVNGRWLEAGQAAALSHRAKIEFPNGATLVLDKEGA